MATIKITELTSIGANLTSSTVIPVVNMSGTPTTEKTVLGNIANVVLTGAGNSYSPAGRAILAQSITNAAQPNITSVGTLTNLAISGNVAVNGNITSNGTAYVGNLSTTGLASITTLAVGTTANLGAVGNVKITGGTDGYVLQTDGTGNLSWTAQTGGGGNGTVGGANTQVQFNDAGDFGGNAGFTFNKTTGIFTSPFLAGNGNGLSNIAGANVSGFVPNANVANTAFAVAGANVSGTVGDANLAQFIDVSSVNNNFSYHLVLSAGDGDKSIHIDADDNLQYNPADGTLTAVRVDATYVLADLQFSNGYPAANVTGLGNIATINLTGSNSNVLYGNGVFAPTTTTYGDSNVVTLLNAFGSNTITTTGNITLGNAIFSDGSTLSGSVLATEVSANIFAGTSLPGLETDYTDSVVMLDDAFTQNSGEAGYPWGITLPVSYLTYDELIQLSPGTFPNQMAVTTIANNTKNTYQVWQDEVALTNVTLTANELNWVFDYSGNLTLPGNTFAVNYANGTQVPISGGSYGNSDVANYLPTFTGNIGAGNVNLSGNIIGSSTITIDNRATGNTADINLYSADDILIQARDRAIGSTSEGGDINIFAGDSAEDSDTSAGDVIIEAGAGGASNLDFGGSGGFVRVEAGRGGAAVGANYSAQSGGSLTLNAGNAGGNNGNIDLGGSGGDVTINAGDSTGNGDPGGSIILRSGDAGANALAGQIQLIISSSDNGDGGTWTFNGAGIFELPNSGTIGNEGNNIDIGSSNAISLEASSAVNIYTDTGTAAWQWQFQDDGNLRLPTIELDVGNTINEQTVIQSQRKIIPGLRYSAEINGTTPTVVYTATSIDTTSMKVTMQIQHTGLGFEFFDVSATSTGGNTFYTVSNRVQPPTISNSTVVVDLNGSNTMEITVTITSGVANSWVTYDATEFGIAVD
jgi:hypothetical protein